MMVIPSIIIESEEDNDNNWLANFFHQNLAENQNYGVLQMLRRSRISVVNASKTGL